MAGVVAIGALGGIGAAIFGGDDEDAFTDTTTGGPSSRARRSRRSPTAGILSPSPIGSATPEPSDGPSRRRPRSPRRSRPTRRPRPSTRSPAVTWSPSATASRCRCSPAGRSTARATATLLGDNQNSFVYAITGTVDPSADAASVIAASIDSILPKQTYTQLRKTDIAPLQAFGSVVSVAAMQYQATWIDQQAVPLQGLLICAVRQDGTAPHHHRRAPADEFKDSSESWAPWSTRRWACSAAPTSASTDSSADCCGFFAGDRRRIGGSRVSRWARGGRWRWRRRPRRGR